jgi:glycosyltransferase involved in cell wall biosynthesis
VIPTYQRPDLLERCLHAVCDQTLPPNEYEVLVCDDHPDAATREIVAKFPSLVHYLAVAGPQHGPAAARNRGWRAARSAIVVFTDDDCVPDRDWLRAGLAALTPEASIVVGAVRVPVSEHPTDYERNFARLADAEFATANCFVRRSALKAVEGFDETFRDAWREDSDLYFTLLERGYRAVHVVGALVVHPLRPGDWRNSLREQRKNIWNALLYRKHPTLYRTHIQPLSPRSRYYQITGLLVCTLAALFGQVYPVAAAAALGWAALTGHFFAARAQATSRSPMDLAALAVTSALIPPLAIYWRLRGAFQHRVVFL